MNERKTVKLVVDNVAQQNARDFWQQFDNMQEKINNLQSKIDKAIEFVESMEYCGQEDYFYDNKSNDPCGNDNTFNDSKNKLLSILKENK